MIRNAWHFYYALRLVFKVVHGSIGIALFTPLQRVIRYGMLFCVKIIELMNWEFSVSKYMGKSNIIYDAFLEQHDVHLFQKQNGNLVLANSGNNSPYIVFTEYSGLSIGISFQHMENPAIEVYLKENLTADEELSNTIFDTFSLIFSRYGVAFSSTKTDGDFDLYLAPFVVDEKDLKVTCSLLKELSEAFGKLRPTTNE